MQGCSADAYGHDLLDQFITLQVKRDKDQEMIGGFDLYLRNPGERLGFQKIGDKGV